MCLQFIKESRDRGTFPLSIFYATMVGVNNSMEDTHGRIYS